MTICFLLFLSLCSAQEPTTEVYGQADRGAKVKLVTVVPLACVAKDENGKPKAWVELKPGFQCEGEDRRHLKCGSEGWVMHLELVAGCENVKVVRGE